MAFKKRKSAVVERMNRRIAGLKSIDPAFKGESGVGVKGLEAARDDLTAVLAKYNLLLSSLDGVHNEVREAELKARDLARRALAVVLVKFGPDSTQYEMAGGTRTSQRKSHHADSAPKPTRSA